ncbi:putative ribonuclease H-like domain-containing protein [Tanacetum coccineum]
MKKMNCLVVTDDYNRFSWVFFLATKDETSGILKSFITGVENLIDQRVKVIRCDNGTKLKNKEMNRFCERKDHLGKSDGKANEGFFVGYSINSKAFRVFNSRTRIVEENLHVQFSENTPNIVESEPNWLFDIDALTEMETLPGKYYILLPLWTVDPPFSQSSKSSSDARFKPSGDDEKKVTKEPGKEGGDSSKDSICSDQEKEDNVNNTNNVNAASTNEVNDVGGKSRIELSYDPNMPGLEDYSIIDLSNDGQDVGAEADMNNLDAFMPVSPIPTTRVHKDHLVEQINRDLNSAPQTRRMTKNLEENGLFSLVHKNKKDEKGIVIKNKARLVAQGHTQEEWIDYDEVFAPIIIIEAIRLFLAYASFKDSVVYQIDVKSAFLYGKIEKEVYVCQPPGFEDPDFPDKVYKVEKALYRLHQAPRAWDKGDILLVQVYVEDIIFGSTNKSLCTEFEKMMHKKFQMSSMGELIFFLGLQVKQKEDGIFISQDKYVTEILKKFGFTNVKTANTPMETQKLLLKDEDGEEVDVYLYRSIIGSLMYLTSSRPDIMFVVCACARYQVNPKVSHLHVVKRIFSLDRKSTTGGINLLLLLKVNAVRHNLLQLLKVNVASEGFEQIVDFLNANPIRYALTINPTIYTSCIEQFWATVKVKTVNGEVQLQALVDGKKIIVAEASVRRDLQLNDEEGTDCLPNATIFKELTRMGYEKHSQKLTFYKAFFSPQWKFLIYTILQCLSAKTTAWNEFSSTMASAIICLATNQKFNFSKYIFESMVKNLDNAGKFLMYPRDTPLFPTMMVQAQQEQGEGSEMPTDPHHTPTIIQPSTSQPLLKQRLRRPKRKDTQVPQPSGPTDNVADEAVYEEIDDNLVRASTTASSLEAEQDSGNIDKTRSKATPNEPSSLGTSSGGGPMRQDTMGDIIA